MLKIGDKAPAFDYVDHNGNKVSSEKLGKNIVLYFYPKDDTPGCTIEANDFNNKLEDFKKADTLIIGISKDTDTSHKKFKDKYCLNFDLIADVDTKTCKEYDVLQEKSMFGKKYIGIERSTFVIGKDGLVKQIWRKVSVNGHASEVLKFVQSL